MRQELYLGKSIEFIFSSDASTLTGTELDSDSEPVNSYFGKQDNNSELY